MKLSLRFSFLFSVLLLLSCETELEEIPIDLSAEVSSERQGQHVIIAADDDLCIKLNNLIDDDIVSFPFGGASFDIDCDINISGKSGITIIGNGSTLVFKSNTVGNGFRININDESSNITINDLNIESDNNAAGDPTTNALEYPDPPLLAPLHTGRIKVKLANDVRLNHITMFAQKGTNGGGVRNQAVHQILIQQSVGSIVRNCVLKAADGELIMLRAATDCKIISNDLDQGWSGIGTTGMLVGLMQKYGKGNLIDGNTVTGSATAYITINDRDAIVTNNTVNGPMPGEVYIGPGIRFGHYTGHSFDYKVASGALCKGNTIRNLTNNASGKLEPAAIKVDYTQIVGNKYDNYDNLIIEGNTIENCKLGIKVSNQPGQYLTVRGNTIETINESIDLYSDFSPQQEQQYCIVEGNIKLQSTTEVIKVFNSSLDLRDNKLAGLAAEGVIRVVSNNATNNRDKAVSIQKVYNSSSPEYNNEIKITNNTFDLGQHSNGIYYNESTNALIGMEIKGNTIRNGHVAIFTGGVNTVIDNNEIVHNEVANDPYAIDWPIYIRYGASGTKILGNTVSSKNKSCVYLWGTDGTEVSNNDFEYDNLSNTYAFAVYMNTPYSNMGANFLNNTWTNFTLQHN